MDILEIWFSTVEQDKTRGAFQLEMFPNDSEFA